MAIQTRKFLPIICLLLSLCLSHSALSHPNVHKKSSFEFIKQLHGVKKGDKAEGIHSLKKYLRHFGYLEDKHLTGQEENLDRLDESTERAIRIYQLNFNLKPTGVLDNETVSKMITPRCGVPDIINGRTRMNGGGKYNINYAFFPGSPKWPLSKKQLTWAVAPGTRGDVIAPFRDFAAASWATASPFDFGYVGEDTAGADIEVSFASQSSGDTMLDGPGNILAYAYAPTTGILVFDADEDWSDGAVLGKTDMGTVGLHELGHVLGLDHSSDENAVMYPYISQNVRKGLSADDIEGIRALYQT